MINLRWDRFIMYKGLRITEAECRQLLFVAEENELALNKLRAELADLRHQLDIIKAGSPKPRKGDWE